MILLAIGQTGGYLPPKVFHKAEFADRHSFNCSKIRVHLLVIHGIAISSELRRALNFLSGQKCRKLEALCRRKHRFLISLKKSYPTATKSLTGSFYIAIYGDSVYC